MFVSGEMQARERENCAYFSSKDTKASVVKNPKKILPLSWSFFRRKKKREKESTFALKLIFHFFRS